MSSSCDFSLTPFAFKLLSYCIISFFTVLNSASVNECVQVGHGTPGRIPVAFLYNLLYSECTAFNSASVLLPSPANFETYCLFWISIRFFQVRVFHHLMMIFSPHYIVALYFQHQYLQIVFP